MHTHTLISAQSCLFGFNTKNLQQAEALYSHKSNSHVSAVLQMLLCLRVPPGLRRLIRT